MANLTLTDWRNRLAIAARNAGDQTYYNNAQLDEALDRLFARFLRVTRCVKVFNTSLAFTTLANTADLSTLTGFMPSRLESVRINVDANYTSVKDELEDVGITEVMNRLSCTTATGTPCVYGFQDTTTIKFARAAQYDGTLSVRYATLQVPWTLGTRGAYSTSIAYAPGDIVSSAGTTYRAIITNTNVAVATGSTWENLGTNTLVAPGSVTSSIPDAIMTELIGIGGPPHLQFRDPEHTAAVAADWERYLAFESTCSGIGSIGPKSIQRQRRTYEGSRW